MSVIIKGMKMPERCLECPFLNADYIFCGVQKREIFVKRADECPLIELPSHGRLIDADALADSFRESVKECHKWADEISSLDGTEADMYARVSQSLGTFVEAVLRTKAAPTILEAEVEE